MSERGARENSLKCGDRRKYHCLGNICISASQGNAAALRWSFVKKYFMRKNKSFKDVFYAILRICAGCINFRWWCEFRLLRENWYSTRRLSFCTIIVFGRIIIQFWIVIFLIVYKFRTKSILITIIFRCFQAEIFQMLYIFLLTFIQL